MSCTRQQQQQQQYVREQQQHSVQPARLLKQRFDFKRVLGEGQYGEVWHCQDRLTKVDYACKKIALPQHALSAAREINALRLAQGHPNVVRLEGVYEEEGSAYLVLELCDSGDMLSLVSEAGGLEEDEARELFRQLASALNNCHEQGIVHRDIKPENIFLTRDCSLQHHHGNHHHSSCSSKGEIAVRLGDFGLSVVLPKGGKAQGVAGSPPYEAPEMINLDPYDQSADVFSLGVVLYAMLSANWPSFAKGRVFNPRVDFSPPIWEDGSVEAQTLICRMLAQVPAERPTVAEILRDPWVTQQPPLLPPPPPPPSLIGSGISHGWLVGGGGHSSSSSISSDSISSSGQEGEAWSGNDEVAEWDLGSWVSRQKKMGEEEHMPQAAQAYHWVDAADSDSTGMDVEVSDVISDISMGEFESSGIGASSQQDDPVRKTTGCAAAANHAPPAMEHSTTIGAQPPQAAAASGPAHDSEAGADASTPDGAAAAQKHPFAEAASTMSQALLALISSALTAAPLHSVLLTGHAMPCCTSPRRSKAAGAAAGAAAAAAAAANGDRASQNKKPRECSTVAAVGA